MENGGTSEDGSEMSFNWKDEAKVLFIMWYEKKPQCALFFSCATNVGESGM